ncbi:MAG: hypothetical protein IPH13_16335 [Planctomycetes bacterium]|nr:hypothetical protein [Planctomycetota bacterium]MCC7170655.1 hypothetical protein [Planctomycetota bacterium]
MLRSLLTCLSLFGASQAFATDWVVDATGAGSSFTTLNQAMVAASPGDRILVHPGSYPAFQMFKGVTVLGLGPSPDAVKIARCDYHPLQPLVNYDSALMNLALGSAADEDSIALTGNELALGTLTLDSVVVDGAVFLRGGSTGFYLQMSNCSVVAQPGEGFAGEAMWFGGIGNRLDVHDSRIVGWDCPESTPAVGAGVGLRLAPGTQARLTDSVVAGGSGLGAGVAGATGLVGSTGTLELLGSTSVHGGNASLTANGGAGVDFAGSLRTGASIDVAGGSGASTGPAYASGMPSALPVDPSITVVPDRDIASGPFAVASGETLGFSTATAAGSTVLLIGFGVDCPPPSAAVFLPLSPAPMLLVGGNALFATVPASTVGPLFGIEVFAQAATASPEGVLLSGVVSTRMNLQ